MHIREVHQKICRLNDDNVVARRNGYFKCPNCEEEYVNPIYLIKHFKTHFGKPVENIVNASESNSGSESEVPPSDDIVQPLPLKENNFVYNKRYLFANI